MVLGEACFKAQCAVARYAYDFLYLGTWGISWVFLVPFSASVSLFPSAEQDSFLTALMVNEGGR